MSLCGCSEGEKKMAWSSIYSPYLAKLSKGKLDIHGLYPLCKGSADCRLTNPKSEAKIEIASV